MKILILIVISLSFVLTDIIKSYFTKGYIFKYEEMECLSPVDTSIFKYDLWYNDSQYYSKLDPHFICCNEPFSTDTIIPSLEQKDFKTYLEILLQDYKILTRLKTNCSLYYGHWFYDQISVHFDITPSTKLGIHPLTIRTIIG